MEVKEAAQGATNSLSSVCVHSSQLGNIQLADGPSGCPKSALGAKVKNEFWMSDMSPISFIGTLPDGAIITCSGKVIIQ